MVGLDFNPNQESTRGIDNNIVDTVDKRNVDLSWTEIPEEDEQKHNEHLHTSGVLKDLGLSSPSKNQPEQNEFPDVPEEQLLRTIQHVLTEIAKETIRHNEKRRMMPPAKQLPIKHTPLTDLLMSLHSQSKEMADRASTPSKHHVATNLLKATDLASKPSVTHSKKESTERSDSQGRSSVIAKVAEATKPSSDKMVPSKSHKKSRKPVSMKRQTSISRRFSQSIHTTMKSGEKIQPKLLLNTLDFAGQKNYRPMHHCFIMRRAMYLVVFNLQEMLTFVEQLGRSPSSNGASHNPLEEVRYWLHSIHAHIYPPDQTEESKAGDKKSRRVSLVGTHRGPANGLRTITDDELDKIDKALRKELDEDSRCKNHLFETESGRIFSAVENSSREIDKSGVRPLQQQLTCISQKLPFLDEEYPVTWIRFQEQLIRMEKGGERNECLTTKEILHKTAEACDVTNPNDALRFFHDTGLLVLLGKQ